MVTVDSLRADHCGFMGCEWDTTPTLDVMADDGLVFENAVAPGPRTPSSMPTVLTGHRRTPARSDDWTWSARYDRIERHMRRFETAAERFQRRGYDTVGFSTNPWTHGTGFDEGFDRYRSLSAADIESGAEDGSALFDALELVMSVDWLADRYGWNSKREWFVTWPHLFDTIANDLGRVDEPYFAWIFLLDTHQPYVTPASYRTENSAMDMYYGLVRELLADADDDLPPHVERRLQQAYRDSIRSIDVFVDRLRSELDDDTALVFHSDHGEAFGEHGTYGHEPVLFEENLHVPLVVESDEIGGRVERPISLQSLPTLLEMLATPGQPVDPSAVTTEVAYATTEQQHKHALRGPDWKYVYNEATGERALYDLARDPNEENDRLDDEVVPNQELARLLDRQHVHRREREQVKSAVERIEVEA